MTVERIFNVRDYGAVGDQITDDTAAINRARKSAMAAGGGTVYYPPGTYTISEPITTDDDVVHRGDE